MKEALVRTRALSSVAARAALLVTFVMTVTLAIGCDSNQDDCVNGDWRCDSSRKEVHRCVNQKWEFVEMCVGSTICREGPGFDCHGPDTACCELAP
jgi:hypothetical protein